MYFRGQRLRSALGLGSQPSPQVSSFLGFSGDFQSIPRNIKLLDNFRRRSEDSPVVLFDFNHQLEIVASAHDGWRCSPISFRRSRACTRRVRTGVLERAGRLGPQRTYQTWVETNQQLQDDGCVHSVVSSKATALRSGTNSGLAGSGHVLGRFKEGCSWACFQFVNVSILVGRVPVCLVCFSRVASNLEKVPSCCWVSFRKSTVSTLVPGVSRAAALVFVGAGGPWCFFFFFFSR